MKELLEKVYNQGQSNGVRPHPNKSFEYWFNKHKDQIDDAILNHIKDNYPTLHSAFVVAKLAKQYDIEVVPKGEGNEQDITLATFGLDEHYKELKALDDDIRSEFAYK